MVLPVNLYQTHKIYRDFRTKKKKVNMTLIENAFVLIICFWLESIPRSIQFQFKTLKRLESSRYPNLFQVSYAEAEVIVLIRRATWRHSNVSLVHATLCDHVSPYLSKNQHGFIRNKSTVNNLLNFADFIAEALGDGSHGCYILLQTLW